MHTNAQHITPSLISLVSLWRYEVAMLYIYRTVT